MTDLTSAHRVWPVLILAMLLLPLAGCKTTPPATGDGDGQDRRATGADTPPTPAESRPEPLKFTDVVRPNDRLLFVGDDVTQQGFYCRGVASAIMAIRSRDGVRFFNGGKNGVKAGDGGQWVDEVIALSKPTVVFICLGFNDGRNLPVTDELKASFRTGLADVIERARGYEFVRRVVVLSPPATHHGVADTRTLLGDNLRLKALATEAKAVAKEKNVDFIDLFDYMLAVYVEVARLGEGPLVSQFDKPTEPAHILISSAILWGVGVTPKMIAPVGWSPLVPRKMGHIRKALAVGNKPVLDLNQAQNSRLLYENLRRFDEVFFRLWRLADPSRTGPRNDRSKLAVEGERIWVELQALSIQMYGHIESPR